MSDEAKKWRLRPSARHYQDFKRKGVPFRRVFTQIVWADVPMVVTVGAPEGGEPIVERLVDYARCGKHVEDNREALMRLAEMLEQEQWSEFAEVVRTLLDNPGRESKNAK